MQPTDITIGQWGRVLAIKNINSSYRSRLISMGLLPGTLFKVIRKAPLGDPFEIMLRGCSLVLRKKEAEILCVEPVCPE